MGGVYESVGVCCVCGGGGLSAGIGEEGGGGRGEREGLREKRMNAKCNICPSSWRDRLVVHGRVTCMRVVLTPKGTNIQIWAL
jgi:hypothetical protein